MRTGREGRLVMSGAAALFLALSGGPSLASDVDAAPERALAHESASTSIVQRIDLNQASVDELSTLPGIGRKRAEAIIAFRSRTPFTRVTQLLNVKGIGRRTLERLRPHVVVTSTVSSSVPPPKRIKKASAKEERRAPATAPATKGLRPPAGCPPRTVSPGSGSPPS